MTGLRAGTLLGCILFLPDAVLAQVKAPPPTGALVIAAGHRLHIHCTGNGSPPVVLVPGMGDFSFDWALVQPDISKETRTCSYDRSGSAWSELGPRPWTMKQEAFTVSEALKNAGVAPPYVLVGHSLGGLVARVFARQYPDRVAGMVFVDSTSEDSSFIKQGKRFRVRDGASGNSIPAPRNEVNAADALTLAERKQLEQELITFMKPQIRSDYVGLPDWAKGLRLWAMGRPESLTGPDARMSDEFAEMYDYIAGHPRFLGAMPLAVLMQGKGNPDGPSDAHRTMAGLSDNSALIVATSSGHHIQIDDPQLVVCATAQVVRAVRRRGQLAVTQCRAN